MESINKLVKFGSQVAGHDNILCLTTNDLMVFKPSSQQEREFYEACQQHEELWTGFLNAMHLCLENILNGFTRPCIVDIKLGYKIYEDTADEAKRNKMIKMRKEQQLNLWV
ncbi:unnamed protein product [Absidia cylindrospora]